MQTATFGAWLKARRKALDLTRVQLASQVGCAEITLEKIERDQRRPSKQIAELLASALQVPTASRDQFMQFARGVGEPPSFDGTEQHAISAKSQPLTNLPAPLTSFIDRISELAAVRARLTQADVRLLTLVGPPGIGKTRLSIQAGQAVLDQFPDGVWFVALAPIRDPTNVLPTLASVLNIADAGATPLLTRLQAHLRPKRLLLVLDNFEHVLDASSVVTDLLKACPKLKVLATSREPLHVYGEHEYPMPALSLPPREKKLALEQLAQFDAIRLFVARAQACQPDFALTASNAQAVADICVRLDGLPLAIELAVSRLRQFELFKLRDALNDVPLQALVGTARDVEPRQRTLRSAIQWSYDLLSSAERIAFNRLGVFVGGCSTEAALMVCALSDDTILHALADRNLLKRDANERWTMLEMIREFALDALAQASGDELERTQQRHAEYFAQLFQPGDDAAYDIIDVEQHNARAALRWLLDHKHPLAIEVTVFLTWYFHMVGLPSEARSTCRAVLAADIEMTPRRRYDLLWTLSLCAGQQQDFKENLHCAQEAMNVARTANSELLIADGLGGLSYAWFYLDDYTQAKEFAFEALRISRSIQNAEHIAETLNQLGNVVLEEGDAEQAENYYAESYEMGQAPNWRATVFTVHACKGLGMIALSHRAYDRALQFLREALERSNLSVLYLDSLDMLAGIIGTMPRRSTSEVIRAAKIWGSVEVQREKTGLHNTPQDRRRIDALIADTRTRIAPKTFAAAWAEGRELPLDEAIELAMAS